ncbi:MAG: alpha/beta hydrolase family protein, partial [Bacteroidota bacterium]
AGWGKDDKFVLIYDRYDIWKIDPRGKEQAENITNGYGRENKIRFRYENLNPDVYHIEEGKIWLSAFRETDKKDGYYTLDLNNGKLERLTLEDASFMQLQKAKNNDVFLWRRGTFKEFPDIWVSNGQLDNPSKISSANPFQSDYLWGTVQLVEWQDFANETLQGLLYLPEDFDPEKQYPMIVYFYERSSQSLHRHYVPSPSRSIINPSYCTSNGYIVFVPDITYREGFPGQSAYNAIVSGTQSMLERYPFINRDRMALQGQSWGGYQIGYLVTKTNMFRAAMAGAPVSNMVSAYGGIRWESGMVRQFQYEQTQSRIGGTLWEKPFHYIENSPVFFVPDIETPLLIMHNDDDGAVPWYQGIELFVAMRRLSKPAWMLVYNKEAHNLRQWPARMDLSVRMYQFFDHYLKDMPAPQWMKEGIPYIEKNKMDGYELTE